MSSYTTQALSDLAETQTALDQAEAQIEKLQGEMDILLEVIHQMVQLGGNILIKRQKDELD